MRSPLTSTNSGVAEAAEDREVRRIVAVRAPG